MPDRLSSPRITAHISQDGFREDRDGFVTVKCGCGLTVGPAPDMETALDMAMEHASVASYQQSVTDNHG